MEYDKLSQERPGEPSANAPARVETTRQLQRRRFEGTDGIAGPAGEPGSGRASIAPGRTAIDCTGSTIGPDSGAGGMTGTGTGTGAGAVCTTGAGAVSGDRWTIGAG